MVDLPFFVGRSCSVELGWKRGGRDWCWRIPVQHLGAHFRTPTPSSTHSRHSSIATHRKPGTTRHGPPLDFVQRGRERVSRRKQWTPGSRRPGVANPKPIRSAYADMLLAATAGRRLLDRRRANAPAGHTNPLCESPAEPGIYSSVTRDGHPRPIADGWLDGPAGQRASFTPFIRKLRRCIAEPASTASPPERQTIVLAIERRQRHPRPPQAQVI